jgi:PucR C-terminal helix-turn-helix domain/GGDEF-like domain
MGSASEFPGRGGSLISRLATEARAEVGTLADRLVDLILESQPDYRQLDADGLADVRRSCHDNLVEILDGLSGAGPSSGTAPLATARRRAEQGIPLGAVLHAYRLGFRVVWEELLARAGRAGTAPVQDLLGGATALWELIDSYSEAVHSAYRETLVDRVRRDEQRQMGLLDALLEGRLGEWSLVGDAARALGLPSDGQYLVVSAEVSAAEFDPLPRVEGVLRREGVRSVWRARPDERIGLVVIDRDHPVATVYRLLSSVAASRVGVSPTFGRLEDAPRAVALATIARDAVPPGSAIVSGLDDRPISTLVSAGRAVSENVARAVLGPVLDLEPADRAVLIDTLRAWFAAGGSASEVGRLLFCHRNTVRNRLARVERLTRRSLADPDAASELRVALEAASLLSLTAQQRTNAAASTAAG